MKIIQSLLIPIKFGDHWNDDLEKKINKLLMIIFKNKLEFSNISKNDNDVDEVKLIPYYGKYDYVIDDIKL